ncbi:MAG: 23S rRNA (adenine(2503)-C(2))-methyltransferase RlmN [Treponema sp.]|nr:23S rRNA (adenine(2503)-C(2))-methyltransferase RlmN [Treponema sp.]MCL2236659.1 23S rRNA (adenine(2503)-C(2))-methyltransferase RlmN [Treponema sp.]
MTKNAGLVPLAGKNIKELEELLSPLPRFRSAQIYEWILKGVFSFEEMTNIPSDLKNELPQKFRFFDTTVKSCEEDGKTKKIAVELKDNSKIEAVLLEDGNDRKTACLSTQVGCPAGCVFCKTGSLGFKRNLEYHEITEQFFHLKNLTNEDGIGNIVIMGMGEPLLNYDNLKTAIETFTDKKGMNFSKRRITVSTCGIVDGLNKIAQNGPYVRLALSLATADEDLRNKLMPVTKANPLDKIKEALLIYQKKSGSRITLELPLLGGINTREKDAQTIANFSKGLDTVINLIPWNPVEGLGFEGKQILEPSKPEIENFKNMLERKKLNVTLRLHKGKKINGACGQLGSI